MGMLLHRHKKVDMRPSEKVVQTSKKVVQPTLDYKELDYHALRAYAKEQGVDLSRHRKKDEILAVLDGKSV